ncbi:MAG: LacI family DNA-binding transcriptional regulator [Chloroflexota bacterium]
MEEEAPTGGAGIRDVARAAGVSISTVSRALNFKVGGGAISQGTVDRVRVVARQLNYRPNTWARSLRTAQTKAIGAIAFDLSHPFAAELLQVVCTACEARGYHVLVGTAEYDSSEAWVLSELLSPDRVDGVILIGDTLLHASGREDEISEAMARLLAVHPHVVTVASRPSLAGESSITVDNAAGVTLGLEHLASLGHARIAHVMDGYHADSWEDNQRTRTYRRFIESHRLSYDPALEVRVGSRDLEAARQALGPLLSLPNPPTALFVNNDLAAITMLKAALLSGVRVPEDLSLVGFDDIAYAALCTPGLTTVHQPIDAMGTYAANLLLDTIGGTQSDEPLDGRGRTVVFPPTLTLRQSCAPAHTNRSEP